MAVLIEGISVVVKADALERNFQGGWIGYRNSAPNQTLCADGELVRLGFMNPNDVAAHVGTLERHGLIYRQKDEAIDLVVVDQMRGPLVACAWIDCGRIDLGEKRMVMAARLIGSASSEVVLPPGWTYEASLSSSFGFAPDEQVSKSLKFLRHEVGVDVYMNELTGKEVFVGRTDLPPAPR